MDSSIYKLDEEEVSWKKSQEYAFLRWVNEQLKPSGKSISSLETDLSDGLILITLIQILSGKKFLKYNKKPLFRSQKLENVSLAIQFLKNIEAIHMVNIDSSDIVDGKLKLILGLIWHLILHYSISKVNWEDDNDERSGSFVSSASSTPEQRLLSWIQNRVSPFPITNFTSDWNDGRALGGLVNSFAPDCCKDWRTWDKRDALSNTRKTMEFAEKCLGVPQLIESEEMVNSSKTDKYSMMTYLAQFRNAKFSSEPEKKGSVPIHQEKNTKQKNNQNFERNKCRAFGKGLETGIANQPNRFIVDTRGVGKTTTLGLAFEGPSETEIICTDNHDGFWTIDYNPSAPGTYDVSILLADEHIDNSPYKVNVISKSICSCEECAEERLKKGQKKQKGSSNNNVKNGHSSNFKKETGNTSKTKSHDASSLTSQTHHPMSVSIVGRNSPQYVSDNGENGNTSCTCTSAKVLETAVNSEVVKIKPEPTKDDHSIFKTTLEIHNGKVKHSDATIKSYDFSSTSNTTQTKPTSSLETRKKPSKTKTTKFDDSDMEVFKTTNTNCCPCKDCQRKDQEETKACQTRTQMSNSDSAVQVNLNNNDKLVKETTMSSTVTINYEKDNCCII